MISISTDGGRTWFPRPADGSDHGDGNGSSTTKEEEPGARLPANGNGNGHGAPVAADDDLAIVGRPLTDERRRHMIEPIPVKGGTALEPSVIVRPTAPEDAPASGAPAPTPAAPTSAAPSGRVAVTAPRSRLNLRTLVIAVGAGVLVAAAVGFGAGVATLESNRAATAPAAPPAGTNPMTLSSGSVVYDDDFSDPLSGWEAGALDATSTARYSIPGLVITGHGSSVHIARSPYPRLLQALGVSAKVRVVTGDNSTAVGIVCSQPVANAFGYAFYVYPDGHYSIVSFSGSPNAYSVEIARGLVPGEKWLDQSNTISAGCVNVPRPNGITVARLMLAVNGASVIDFVDTLNLDGLGWSAGLASASSPQQPSEVAYREVSIRDLTGAGAGD